MSLSEKLADRTMDKLGKHTALAGVNGDGQFLEFLMQLFDKLLPMLVGCFDTPPAAAAAMRSPGRWQRVRLKFAIHRELPDRECRDMLAVPVFDAIIEAGQSVTDEEVAASMGS